MASRYVSGTKEEVLAQLKNVFVRSYSERNDGTVRIEYTDDFYRFMKLNLENGMTDVRASEACGFDIHVMGEARAHKAAEKARKLGNTKRETFGDMMIFDVTKPIEEYGPLTPEEERDYYRCKDLYNEAYISLLKKKRHELEKKKSSSKKKKKKRKAK